MIKDVDAITICIRDGISYFFALSSLPHVGDAEIQRAPNGWEIQKKGHYT